MDWHTEIRQGRRVFGLYLGHTRRGGWRLQVCRGDNLTGIAVGRYYLGVWDDGRGPRWSHGRGWRNIGYLQVQW